MSPAGRQLPRPVDEVQTAFAQAGRPLRQLSKFLRNFFGNYPLQSFRTYSDRLVKFVLVFKFENRVLNRVG